MDLKRLTIAVICGSLPWKGFDEVFLSQCSGTSQRGGYPVLWQNDLRAFLTNQGFARCPAPVQQATSQNQECYRGSFQGSRSFFVMLWIQTNAHSSLYVQTSYDFEGFSSRVNDSQKKADEFSRMLDSWLADRQMEKINSAQAPKQNQ